MLNKTLAFIGLSLAVSNVAFAQTLTSRDFLIGASASRNNTVANTTGKPTFSVKVPNTAISQLFPGVDFSGAGPWVVEGGKQRGIITKNEDGSLTLSSDD